MRTKAEGLYNNIKGFIFIASLVISKIILSYTSGITTGLQAVSTSILSAYHEVENVISTLKKVRTDVETHHKKWYEEAKNLAQSIGTEVALKRNQAKKYEDCPGDVTSVFFLREITIPLLDELIEEMCARFNENTVAYADSFYFIPSVSRKSITQNGDSWKSKVKQFMNSNAGDMHDTSIWALRLNCGKING